MTQAEIGIIIVTYNSEAVIGACLDAATLTGARIVVVDNASADSTRREVEARGVRLIANAANRGFATACNQGAAALDCPYLLLLNPDALLVSGLDELRAACDLPGSAGAGGKLLDAAGRPQIGFMVRELPTPLVLSLEALLLNRVWPNNPVNRRYRGLGRDYSRPQVVGQPAGAFLMIRRSVWEETAGLDEQFWPLWFEDVDFCKRLAARGYSLQYEPKAVAKHTGAHSIPTLTVEMRRIYWYRSLFRYAAKHFSAAGASAVCLAVISGSCLRAIVESVLDGSLRPVVTYSKVARLACRFLIGRRGGLLPSGFNP